MVGMVSSFRRAANFTLSVRNKAKRQISRAFSELKGDGTNLGPPGATPRISPSTPRPTGTVSSPRISRPSTPQRSCAGRSTVRPSSQPNRKITTQRRSRDLGGSSRNVQGGNKRNRKAIANTQADKKGTDSAGMTSLQTSGIDGKGLKINQIR